ncbi:hypothetical protein ACEN88_34970, partial [Massilia sp. CT11-108]|uniref:hypothetical protein n=1 Tax=Massilia sp. CT11-108 TaxID=3393900 RepID=UPI0039A6AA18
MCIPDRGGAPARDYGHAPPGVNDTITALYRGPAGDVWAAGFGGLWTVRPDGSGWRRLHPGIDGPATTYAMAQDSAIHNVPARRRGLARGTVDRRGRHRGTRDLR